jgi:ATP-dependent Clp protease ATP-binding subunit ClpA
MTENSNLIVSPSADIDLSTFGAPLEIGNLGPLGQKMFDYGTGPVIGQDLAWVKLAKAFTNYNSGLRLEPDLPIANALLLGPTGTGKSMTVKILARYLIDPDFTSKAIPFTLIAGADYAEKHSVANLFGAPLGYKGSDKTAVLAQANIDAPAFWAKMRKHPEFIKARAKGNNLTVEYFNSLAAELYVETGPHISVIVVDEIEKADPALWNVFLHIMGDGVLTMSGEDGSQTYFNNSVVIFTGNIGSRQQQEHATKRKPGFDTPSKNRKDDRSDKEIYKMTRDAARALLPLEFMNRIGKNLIVFRSLLRSDVERAADRRFITVQERLNALPGGGPQVVFAPEFREFIVDVGHNDLMGMRPLDQEFEDKVMFPLSVLLEDGRIKASAKLLFTVAGKKTDDEDKRRTEIRPGL